MFVCCECCVLSGTRLCNEMITRPEESYRLWCVVLCDLETSTMRRPWPAFGRSATGRKRKLHLVGCFHNYIRIHRFMNVGSVCMSHFPRPSLAHSISYSLIWSS
jgi:hypothetical protein